MAFTPSNHPEIPQVNDKILHLLAFGYLTLALRWAYPAWARPHRIFCLLFAYGVLIEIVQGFIPRRQSSGWDLIVDVMGILVALVGIRLLSWLWSWRITPKALNREKTTAGR